MINKSEFNETQEKLFDTLLFMGKLLLAGSVFHFILWLYPNTVAFQSFLAQLVGGMLSSTGFSVEVVRASIFTSGAEYIITQDCLGWKSMAAFIGLMFASTGRTLEHLNFILQGLVVIILANTFRVYTTVFLAERGIISFNVIHNFLWSWSLTFIVFAVWGYWFTKLRDQEQIYQQRIRERVKEISRK
jgi:exosortase/archaeosortase family protein